VDVKAQSHSTLYNRAEESFLAATLVRQRGEKGKEKSLGGENKKASICVCLPTALYIQHASHELLVNWQNEVLAIKMLIFPTLILF